MKIEELKKVIEAALLAADHPMTVNQIKRLFADQAMPKAGEIKKGGVSVSSNIIHSLMERNWIAVIGHKEVPGRPGMYATTPEFLDYFNLKSLDELPTLEEIADLDKVNPELALVASVKNEATESDVEHLDAESDLDEDNEAVPIAIAVEDTSNVTKH